MRFEAAGFPCLNLANGTERAHQPDERVSVDALEGMLEVAIALVEEAGARASRRRYDAASSSTSDSEVSFRGKVIKAGTERFRHEDGEEVTRDKVWHPGAVGIVAVDEDHVWLTRQPREAAGIAGLARGPGRQARRARRRAAGRRPA